jgi:hypothetical protein
MDITRADADAHEDSNPQIDTGLREWYESCPCCMSKAMADVKQALDRERALRPEPPAVGSDEVST